MFFNREQCYSFTYYYCVILLTIIDVHYLAVTNNYFNNLFIINQ